MDTICGEKWKKILQDEFAKPYFADLTDFLTTEYATQTIFPPREKVFAAFSMADFDDIKVIILGQDPYHGEGQAHGLSFSVPHNVKRPPSLVNIYKGLAFDLDTAVTRDGDLSDWASQGVLLLNSVLTVRKGCPQSHANKGWETFSDNIISALNASDTPKVFLLWGGYAKSKARLVTNSHHLILTGAHPSPLSFYHGFLTNHHFSLANAFLIERGRKPINWLGEQN
ncbi:MAG: uracil-DNA glycosylase [Clostridia bacterium]